MSEPRHRLEPADPTTAFDLSNYPPPINIRSIDFNAVAPSGRASAPVQYTPVSETRHPTGDGPDQWAEEAVPESVSPEPEPVSPEPTAPEADDLALAR